MLQITSIHVKLSKLHARLKSYVFIIEKLLRFFFWIYNMQPNKFASVRVKSELEEERSH